MRALALLVLRRMSIFARGTYGHRSKDLLQNLASHDAECVPEAYVSALITRSKYISLLRSLYASLAVVEYISHAQVTFWRSQSQQATIRDISQTGAVKGRTDAVL